jgi:hypothetical protein
MKKFLMIMGAIFCALIVLAIVAGIFGAIRGARLDKESRAYADEVIPAIVTTWDVDAFFARTSPELKKLVTANDADRLFRSFSQLGHLEHRDPARGQAMTSAILGQPRRTTGHYEAAAQFKNGSATIKIDLIKHGNQWQLLGFHIDSPAFLPK